MVELVPNRVCAGLPRPAECLGAERIDLTMEFITQPLATSLLRVNGDSMRDAGIIDNDILLINKAINHRNNKVVVAVVDGQFAVKKLYKRAGRIKFYAARPACPDIVPKET